MSDEVRVLTVRQPWAWAIVHGGKDVENRTKNVAGGYRGLVAIHAGLRADSPSDPRWLRAKLDRPMVRAERLDVRGFLLGVARIAGAHRHYPGMGCDTNGQSDMRARVCSPWGEDGAWHIVLEEPRALVSPVPWVGALGLRRSGLTVVEDGLFLDGRLASGLLRPYTPVSRVGDGPRVGDTR